MHEVTETVDVHATPYAVFRRQGHRATDALRIACAFTRFAHAQAQGRVRLLFVLDIGGCDPIADCDGYTERERERQYRMAERNGVWGLVSEALVNGEWIHADSVWGFYADAELDIRTNPYAADVMLGALDALSDAFVSAVEGFWQEDSSR